jgi:hypothetical protein
MSFQKTNIYLDVSGHALAPPHDFINHTQLGWI